MDAQTKALKAHRKRLQARRMRRVEVTVNDRDAAMMRKLAAKLRRDDAGAKELRETLQQACSDQRGSTLAELLYDPAIAGAEFDEVFAEIERSRHDPVMMKIRDVDL